VQMSLFPIPHVFLFLVIFLKRPLMASYYVPVLYSCQDFLKGQIAGCVYTYTQICQNIKQPGFDIKAVSIGIKTSNLYAGINGIRSSICSNSQSRISCPSLQGLRRDDFRQKVPILGEKIVSGFPMGRERGGDVQAVLSILRVNMVPRISRL
jgi:hypothetical protein